MRKDKTRFKSRCLPGVPLFFAMMLFAAATAALFSPAAVSAQEADEVAVNNNGIITVGYVMIGAESDWRLACNKSVEEAFTRANGYSLLISDAQQKQDKQIKAVREFVNQEVDYILLNPIVESGWDASLEEAREAGIPVIAFDREVDVKDENAYTAWLGSDFYLEGEKA